METERVADAAKRPAEEDESPRERKKSRKSTGEEKDAPATTPTDAQRKANNAASAKVAHAVTPEPTRERKLPSGEEGSVPMPPPASEYAKLPPTQGENSAAARNTADNQPTAAPAIQAAEAPSPSDAPNQAHLSPSPQTSRFPSLFQLFFFVVSCCAAGAALLPRTTSIRTFGHVIPPKHAIDAKSADMAIDLESFVTKVTLRDFLADSRGFHLAMAPSFFGFFGYFGLLDAWDEGLSDNESSFLETNTIKSTAGASAGAMAAVLLAGGIPPKKAAEFCSTIDLPTFADPLGIGSFFKGDKFEQLMFDFMQENLGYNLQIEDAKIPVAVTGFDLQTLDTLVMTKGCAARSSRASATFPFLFQPVHWFDSNQTDKDYVLIDGGVLDPHGLVGLTQIEPDQPNKRVVNVVVGAPGLGGPLGPSEMPAGLDASEVLSISVRNLPGCGPWAMENGPRAVEAAKKAMMASLDLPLYAGKEQGHYELHIDASSFAPEVN